ncbi:MAG: BLUF domain-containing protein [Candidatus Competibacterales bacterium]
MKRCRLIYRSVLQPEVLEKQGGLSTLVAHSQRKNKQLCISGLLLVSELNVVQVLEGPDGAVNDLYATIIHDPRHHHVRLASFEPIGELMFEHWSMRQAQIEDFSAGMRRMFLSRYGSNQGKIFIPNDPSLLKCMLLDAQYSVLKAESADEAPS